MKKPEILLLTDVDNWAWQRKALALQSRLEQFTITIHPCVTNGIPSRVWLDKFDLIFAFGTSLMPYIERVPTHRKIVGVTAHLAHRDPRKFRRAILQAKAVCVNSILLYEEFRSWHRTIFYCPNGVDERFFAPPQEPRTGPIVFSTVGKYCPEKGYDDFIMPAAAQAGVPLRAVLKDYRDALNAIELRAHYWSCDVHVTCSTIDGTPNPALESASCGLSQLSNPIGNMPEFIEDGVNGRMVERALEDYREKMVELALVPEETRHMGAKARETVQRDWSWDLRAKAYGEMLEKLLP
jgi:glycosyltransferase involved in cell wall biosynthesis